MKTKCPFVGNGSNNCPYKIGGDCRDIEIGPENGDSWCRLMIEENKNKSASLAGYVCLADRWLDIATKFDEVAELFEFSKEAQIHYKTCAAIYESVAKELSSLLEQEAT